MKTFILSAIAALLLCSTPVFAQLTQVTATAIRIGGTTIGTGLVCAVPVDANDNPINVTVGSGGGLDGTGQNCANISAGAITTATVGGTYALPDTALAGNAGFNYDFTVTDTVTKQSFMLHQVPNVKGSVFVLDHYFPTITVPTAQAFTFTTGSGAPGVACIVKSFYEDISVPTAPVLYQCGSDLGFHLVSPGGGGGGAGALIAVNNLSDLGSAATARANLGLGTAAQSANSAFDASGTATTAVAAIPQGSASVLGLLKCGSGTACASGVISVTGGGGSVPTGSGFPHITSGAQDPAARAVDLSSADATGIIAAAREPAFTGDVTNSAGSTVTTLATVNSTTGACGDSTHVCAVTTNGKGLVTAQAAVAITGGSGGLGDPGANGIVKRTALNTTVAAVAGTDYVTPTGSSATLSVGSAAAFGVLKVDGTSCTTSAGVLSCSGVGGGMTSLTGDVTASGSGAVATTVVKLNGTSLAGLATGLLKITTGTGVPSTAVAADVVAALATDTVNNSSYGFHTGSGGDTTCPTPVSGSSFICQKAGVIEVSLSGAAYVPYVNGNPIVSISVTTGTTAIAANTCNSVSTATMTGVATTSTFAFSPNADVAAVTGWGATGGLSIDAWPTSNTLNYKVCNQTNASITPGASVTFNVSAK